MLPAAALVSVGCWGTPAATMEQLKARATFDLQCPLPEVQIQELDTRTQGVRGCGRQLTYVETCESRADGWHCAWVINSAAWLPGVTREPPTPERTYWYTKPQGPQPGPPHMGPPPHGPPPHGPPVTGPPGPPGPAQPPHPQPVTPPPGPQPGTVTSSPGTEPPPPPQLPNGIQPAIPPPAPLERPSGF